LHLLLGQLLLKLSFVVVAVGREATVLVSSGRALWNSLSIAVAGAPATIVRITRMCRRRAPVVAAILQPCAWVSAAGWVVCYR
jgi:hypothetical protein